MSMHELAVTKSIIRVVVSECRRRNVKTPKKVIIELGNLTAYKKEPVLFYFDMLKTEERMLSETVLEVNEMPGKIRCNKCKKESGVNEAYLMMCPECESTDVEIIQGKDFIIASIETGD
ncbi:MAG: hydrogenase maturation nickel metallochaperone HypA [Candidatus Micrarchaeota archaeon]